MSEAYLDIHFTCKTEHAADWLKALTLLANNQRGASFQDALDLIK